MYVTLSVINNSYIRSFYKEKCLKVITILVSLLRRMIFFRSFTLYMEACGGAVG